MTPLNFVCKCRAPSPRRKPLAVFRKTRIEQIFGRARIRDLFFARCRNADGLRVFVMPRHLLFCLTRAARSPASTRLRSRENTCRNGFTKGKIFLRRTARKGILAGVSGRKTHESVRAIRFGGTAGAACDAVRHGRAGDFRTRFGRTHGARRNFSARANAESGRAQIPRRFLSSSLTACGLALPPDAFIT